MAFVAQDGRLQRLNPESQLSNFAFAEAEGLVPRGEALDAIVKTYLARKIGAAGDEKTVLEVLRERAGTRESLSLDDLEEVLQVIHANEALAARYVLAPAVPSTVALGQLSATGAWDRTTYQRIDPDLVEVSEVTLQIPDDIFSAAKEKITSDEAAIAAAYQELQNRFFRIPDKRTITIYSADAGDIAKKLKVTDAEAKGFYEENKDRWKIEEEAPAADDKETAAGEEKPEEEKPTHKPFADVKEEIVN